MILYVRSQLSVVNHIRHELRLFIIADTWIIVAVDGARDPGVPLQAPFIRSVAAVAGDLTHLNVPGL